MSVQDYVQVIRATRQKLQDALDAVPEDQHMNRLVYISQIQIVDAILAQSKLFDGH